MEMDQGKTEESHCFTLDPLVFDITEGQELAEAYLLLKQGLHGKNITVQRIQPGPPNVF